MKRYVDVEIYKSDDNVYIACSPEFNICSNGRTQKEAAVKLMRRVNEFIDKHDTSFNARRDIDYTARYYSARLPQTH